MNQILEQASKQGVSQVAQTKHGSAKTGVPQFIPSIDGKEKIYSNMAEMPSAKKYGFNEGFDEKSDSSADAGTKSAADHILLAQSETTATDAVPEGASSSASGVSGAEADAATGPETAGSGGAAGASGAEADIAAGSAGSAGSGGASGVAGAGSGAAAGTAAMSGGMMALGGLGLAALAGGGGGGAAVAAVAAAAGVPVGGIVADGLIRGAKIYADTNGNGVADPGEDTGLVSHADGTFSGTITKSGALLAVGGTDTSTGLANCMVLKAPSGSTVINPITTLIQDYVLANHGTSVAAAETVVQNALGITGTVNLLTYDPIAHNDLAIQKIAAQIATIAILSGNPEHAFGNITAEIHATPAGTVLNFTDPAVIATATAGALDPVADSQVLANISAATTAIHGAGVITDIYTSQCATLEAAVPTAMNLAAGSDSGASHTDRLTSNTTCTVSGMANPNATVTLFDTDGTTVLGTGTADGATGAWSITTSTLAAGVHNITAVAANLAANSTPSPVLAITIDTTAPALSSSTPSDNATAVLVGNNIVLTFSENVVAGAGNIVISDGTDTRTIAVGDATQVTISGNQVSINPAADLNANATYYVRMASGVITDVAGNAYAGIADTTTLNFGTTPTVTVAMAGSLAAGTYNLLDTAANLATAGITGNGAVNITASDVATVANATGIAAFTNSGAKVYNLGDTAARSEEHTSELQSQR